MHRATLFVYLALAAVAAIAAAAGTDHGSGQGPIRTQASGAFSLANSGDGLPVFTAANIGPGDSAKGTVEISNEGSEAIAVTLAQHDLTDTPGASGGVLSQRLALKVGDPSSSSPVYEGPLAAMQPRSLARLAPGASRSYEFTVTLPASASDNAFQGASVSVAYSWTAQEAPAAVPSPPVASPPTAGLRAAPPPPQLSAHLVGYRATLRNGRIITWVHCNKACRVGAYASFLTPRLPGKLPATAHHAQQRRFGARTRRLAVKLPGPKLRLLSGIEATARIVVVARSRGGERTETSALLHLRAR